jgi:hypothetical protein
VKFGSALVVGKEEADQRMIRSIYQRGVGYDYDAVKIFMPAGAKSPIYAPYVEHVPPDPAAGMFWLKNRQPDKWRDVHQLEHVTGKYVISDKPMSVADWVKHRAVVVDGDDAVVGRHHSTIVPCGLQQFVSDPLTWRSAYLALTDGLWFYGVGQPASAGAAYAPPCCAQDCLLLQVNTIRQFTFVGNPLSPAGRRPKRRLFSNDEASGATWTAKVYFRR